MVSTNSLPPRFPIFLTPLSSVSTALHIYYSQIIVCIFRTVNIETKTSLIVIADTMASTSMTGRARGGSALRIFGNRDVVVFSGRMIP
jgi:uncharacterized protein YmfQ (DUF2313 family)